MGPAFHLWDRLAICGTGLPAGQRTFWKICPIQAWKAGVLEALSESDRKRTRSYGCAQWYSQCDLNRSEQNQRLQRTYLRNFLHSTRFSAEAIQPNRRHGHYLLRRNYEGRGSAPQLRVLGEACGTPFETTPAPTGCNPWALGTGSVRQRRLSRSVLDVHHVFTSTGCKWCAIPWSSDWRAGGEFRQLELGNSAHWVCATVGKNPRTSLVGRTC